MTTPIAPRPIPTWLSEVEAREVADLSRADLGSVIWVEPPRDLYRLKVVTVLAVAVAAFSLLTPIFVQILAWPAAPVPPAGDISLRLVDLAKVIGHVFLH